MYWAMGWGSRQRKEATVMPLHFISCFPRMGLILFVYVGVIISQGSQVDRTILPLTLILGESVGIPIY